MDATTSGLVNLIQSNINSQNFAITTQWFNIGVLVVTAIILAITAKFIYDYTQATLDLRDAAREEIDLGMLPLLGIEFENRSGNPPIVMLIKNIGKGPALNIKVSPFTLESEGKKFRSEFKLKGYNILHADQDKALTETVFINDVEEKGHSLIPHIHPEFATQDYDIKITFDNSLGKSYQTIIRTGKDGMSISRPPKRA